MSARTERQQHFFVRFWPPAWEAEGKGSAPQNRGQPGFLTGGRRGSGRTEKWGEKDLTTQNGIRTTQEDARMACYTNFSQRKTFRGRDLSPSVECECSLSFLERESQLSSMKAELPPG